MTARGTLLLTRREVAGLLGLDECIEAVERVFKMLAEGNAPPPAGLAVHARDGALRAADQPDWCRRVNWHSPVSPGPNVS